MLHKDKGFALHLMKMNLQRKTITVNGHSVAMIDSSELLKYNKFEDIEVEVQNLMGEKADKKLVATTVSNREARLKKKS